MSEERQNAADGAAPVDKAEPASIEEYRDQLAAEDSYTLSQPLELRSKEGRLMSRKAEVALRDFRGRDIRESRARPLPPADAPRSCPVLPQGASPSSRQGLEPPAGPVELPQPLAQLRPL